MLDTQELPGGCSDLDFRDPVVLRDLFDLANAARFSLPDRSFRLLSFVAQKLAEADLTDTLLGIRTLGLLGEAASVIGRTEDSKTFLREALDVAQKVLSSSSSSSSQVVYAELLCRLASCEIRKRGDRANLFLNDSIEILRRQFEATPIIESGRNLFAEALLLRGHSSSNVLSARELFSEVLVQAAPDQDRPLEFCLSQSAMLRLLSTWYEDADRSASVQDRLKLALGHWLVGGVDQFYTVLLKWNWAMNLGPFELAKSRNLSRTGLAMAKEALLRSVLETLQTQGYERAMIVCSIDVALCRESGLYKEYFFELAARRYSDASVPSQLKALARLGRDELLVQRHTRLLSLPDPSWSYPISLESRSGPVSNNSRVLNTRAGFGASTNHQMRFFGRDSPYLAGSAKEGWVWTRNS